MFFYSQGILGMNIMMVTCEGSVPPSPGGADPVGVQAEEGAVEGGDEEDDEGDGPGTACRDAPGGQCQNAAHLRLFYPWRIR